MVSRRLVTLVGDRRAESCEGAVRRISPTHPMSTSASRWMGFLAAAALVSACGAAGQYGHSRSYVALSSERDWEGRAQDSVHDEVRRMPDLYQGRTLSGGGDRGGGGARGRALAAGDAAAHAPGPSPLRRRVRVELSGDGEPARRRAFHGACSSARRIRPGSTGVQPNSLVRVYGTLRTGEYDVNGGPVLRAEYYRHWPRGEYVTTGSAGSWRC